ncbi:MAG TPA: GAF domain-containing protein [Anaerolineaceae bacterium]|nr:GAF domain-containing protein [Anaerolineaceae bacterium]
MPDRKVKNLEAIFSSPQVQHVLYEVAHAARLILKVDASIIFLMLGEDCLTASAWHGREARGYTISSSSPYIKALLSGRRSITWFRSDGCADPEIQAFIGEMGLTAGLLVPLHFDRQFFGVWFVSSASSRSFSDADESILKTLVENIALTTESIMLSADNIRLQREANALYEIGKEISQLMDLNRVLKVIAERTCSLMGAELSYIALADDERQEVRVVITEGTRGDLLQKMVLKYGEGVGGYVASSRSPQLVDSYPKDPRPKPPDVELMAASEAIQSIISVPMITRTGLIGVLFAASRREASFDQSQMNLLVALGTQAAIAIENARLYEMEKVTAERMRVSKTTNEHLLQLVLSNSGLQAIVDTLAQLISCPVVVEDSLHRVLCVSATGAGDQESQWQIPTCGTSTADIWTDPELADQVRVLRENWKMIRIPPRPHKRIEHSRMIAPIVAGDNLLGHVTALEIDRSLKELQQSAVEQASIVIALEFLKQETAQAVEQRLVGDFLDDLINDRGMNDPAIFQRAYRFGVDLHSRHRIMVLDVDKFAHEVARHRWTDVDALEIKRRFFRTVSEVVEKEIPGSLVSMQSDSVLLLLPLSPHCQVSKSIAFGKRIQSAVRESLPDLSISIGIGRAAADPVEISRSFQDAQLALRIISTNKNKNSVVAYEELGVIPLLLQSDNQSDLTIFMQRLIGRLLEYDAQNNAELVPTLQHYLDNNGHLQSTASACHIHINSLKYRIQRIEEILGVDLHDGQARFNLALALSIHSATTLLTERSARL